MLRRVYEATSSFLWPKKRKLEEGPDAEPEGRRVRQEDVVGTSQGIVTSLTEESVSPAVIRPLSNGSVGCTRGGVEGPRVADVGREDVDFFDAASEARVFKKIKFQTNLELEVVSPILAGRLPSESEAVDYVDAMEPAGYGEQHEAGQHRTGENDCASDDTCEDQTHVSTASKESESTSPPPVNIPPEARSVECGHGGEDGGHGDLVDVSSSMSPLLEGGEEEEEEWGDGRVVERGADMNSRSLTPDVPCSTEEQHGDEHDHGITAGVESGGKGEESVPRDGDDVGDGEGQEEHCVSGDGGAELEKEEERVGDHGADGGASWSRQHGKGGQGGSDTEEEDILAGGTQRSSQAHDEHGSTGGVAMAADGVYGDEEETDDDDIRSPASKLPRQTRNLEDDMDREQEEDGDGGVQVDCGSAHDEQSNVGRDSSTLSSSSSTQSVSPPCAAPAMEGGDHQQDAGVNTASTSNDSADEVEIIATIPGPAAETGEPEVIEISDEDD